MKILKIFWGRRDDGIWEIADLHSIDLKGTAAVEGGLYPIQDDVVVTQSSVGTVKSVMGASIVPVVANVQGESTLRCVGTGFFVSCTGLLVTAAHVITDPIDRRYAHGSEINDLTWYAHKLNFGIMIPSNPLLQKRGYQFYPFEWSMILAERSPHPLPFSGVDLKLTSDIAICKVPLRADGAPHQPLTIVQRSIAGTGMIVGVPAWAIGYAGMADVELTRNAQGEITGDFRFDLWVSTGTILQRFPDNLEKKEVPTPGPCFSFGAKIPGGMSGAPILDKEGVYAHGVVSRGWEGEMGLMEYGFGFMLGPSLGLPIARLGGATLQQLQDDLNQGMAKFSAPGI